jgi:catechol 2,3-dioxygenase-like lactoylglutathione lyase family enzyme
MITSIHTLIYSDDAAATRAFLRDVLGWKYVTGDWDEDWLIFQSGRSEMGVHPTHSVWEGKTYEQPRHHAISLMCDDLDATVAELQANFRSERFLHISFAHRRGPDSADDDGVSTNRVDDFPATEDQLAPATVAQFVENGSSFRMVEKNLCAIVDAKSDARRCAGIAARDVAKDRFDVARCFLRPDYFPVH